MPWIVNAIAGLLPKSPNEALIEASWSGRKDSVVKQLARGADPNAVGAKIGDTPLGNASCSGHTEVVRLLLDAGADANVRSGYGYTPLGRAADNDKVEVVRMLLTAGADVNVRDGTKYGTTPLCWASRSGHSEVVRLLIDAGADVNAPCGDRSTPLKDAVFHDHIDVVKMLLASGADVNATASSQTPLQWAVQTTGNDKPSQGMIRLLLAAGADVNASKKGFDPPLCIAAQHDDEDVVRQLLEAGADATNSANCDLWRLANHDSTKMINLLLVAGADVNAVDKQGATPLTYACMKGHTETVKVLLEAGADIKLSKVFEPEYWGRVRGHDEVFDLLRAARATAQAARDARLLGRAPAAKAVAASKPADSSGADKKSVAPSTDHVHTFENGVCAHCGVRLLPPRRTLSAGDIARIWYFDGELERDRAYHVLTTDAKCRAVLTHVERRHKDESAMYVDWIVFAPHDALNEGWHSPLMQQAECRCRETECVKYFVVDNDSSDVD